MYIPNLNRLLQEKIIDEKNPENFFIFFQKKLLTLSSFYDILIKYSGESISRDGAAR